jgi:molybdenum transport protein
MLRDAELELLLAEDVPYGDLTSEALELGPVAGELSFAARRSMVVCCTEEAARLFALCGSSAVVLAHSGGRAEEGAPLLSARGPATALLAAWKVAQNLVEWTSGIASATARLLAAAREGAPEVTVACTRKAFPGTRALAVRAVRAGGGSMHRLGLSESLLVFPEHRAFNADVPATQWLSSLRSRERERRITVEVTTLDDALALAAAGAEALQLERFSPSDVATCKARLEAAGLRPLLLAAGGVNEVNAAAFARAGATVLVSSAPYQAAPADVKVSISTGARRGGA